MVFSDTPAIDGGETAAQIFVGTESFVTDVEGMKSESQFINTLEDSVHSLDGYLLQPSSVPSRS